MRSVTMTMAIEGMSADELYARVGNFSEYPRYTDAVRDVDVTETGNGRTTSDWEINFRDGVMRWKEEDVLVPAERRIDFSALGGDLELFTGSWQIAEADGGATLTFSADFDLGLATLNDMVEPIAEEALRESIERIVMGLTDERATVVEGRAAASA
jgi:ribosome-associated toxin RatA of RatAB toxin-antitoxin module